MTNKKSTKKALISSALCLLLCMSMLIGTTFAWFTDEVKSGKNQIVAGNLDVELEYAKVVNGTMTDWATVEGAANIFDSKALWEPGRVEVVYLKVSNLGTLALKYQLGVNVYGEIAGTNVAGEEFKLSDHLVFKTVEMPDALTTYTDREAAQLASGTEKGLKDYNGTATALEVGGVDYLALIVYMPETVGNEANYRGDALPTIELGVNLFATQQMAESDSFGDDYDNGAYLPTVYTAEELQSALENNESVQLGADIVLTDEWKPIGDKDAGIYYTGTLDGNGHTISGLNVTANDYDAFISAAKDAVIKNLTVEGVVDGVNAAGIVARVEGNTTIENCVNNVTVKGATKAGGIACNVTGANAKIINCVNNANISGGKDGIGGIVGYVNNDTYLEIINCTNNGDVTSDVNKYAGAAVGYGAKSTGLVVDFTNTGVITGTLAGGNRFLKDGDTVLVGYVNTPGAWKVGATPSSIQAMINAANAGDVIVLTAGEYHDTIVMKSDVTLQGSEGAVVDCINLNGADNVTLKGITFDAAGAKLGYDGRGNAKQYANIISREKGSAVDGGSNIVIENCIFTGEFANGGVSIAFTDQNKGTYSNITIKGCTFETTNTFYSVYTHYSGSGYFNIEGNTFATELSANIPVGVKVYDIYLGRYQSSTPVVVKGNVFEKVTSFADAAYIQDHSTYGVSFDAADNTFNG